MHVWPALLLMMLIPSLAHADRDVARHHYRKAMKLYDLRKFEAAAKTFELAYDEDPAAILLFNIAQSYWQLGAAEQALFFYRRYLDAAPDATNRPTVEARVTALQRQLEEPAIKTTLAPADAEAPGQSPPQDAPPRPDQPAAIPASPPPPSTAAPPATDGDQGTPGISAAAGAHTGAGAPLMRMAAYTTGALGAISLAAGVLFGAQAKAAGREASSAVVFDAGQDREGKRKETIQYVLLGSGGAFVLTSGLLFFLDLRREESAEEPALAVRPLLSPRTAGAFAHVEF